MAGDTSTQLHKAQLNLKKALTKIGENNRELRELREKSTSLSSALEAAEQKYANEMILQEKVQQMEDEIKSLQDSSRMSEELENERLKHTISVSDDLSE